MKKLSLLFLILTYAFTAIGQSSNIQPIGNKYNTVQAQNNLQALGWLAPGILSDTPAVVAGIPIGALVIRSADSITYRLKTTASNVQHWYAQGLGVTSLIVNGGSPQTGAVALTIPTDVAQLGNSVGYITAAQAPVTSVNGQGGAVTVLGSITKLSAGANIGITGLGTTASPYVITGTGGGGGGGSDADSIRGAPVVISGQAQNYALVYDTTGVGAGGPGRYIFRAISTTFAGLTDVTITSPANGQVALYNTSLTKWVNTTPPWITTISGIAAGGDLSGTYPNPTVSSFAGNVPSYYLNYTNLTGKPTIPVDTGISTYGNTRGILKVISGTTAFFQVDSTAYGTLYALKDSSAALRAAIGSGGVTQVALTDTSLAIRLALTDSITAVRSTTYTLYARQGVSPLGTHLDSMQLGGIVGAFFQPDSIYTNGQPFLILSLPSRGTVLGNDSAMIVAVNGQLFKSSFATGSPVTLSSNGLMTPAMLARLDSTIYFANSSIFPTLDSAFYSSLHHDSVIAKRWQFAGSSLLAVTDSGNQFKNAYGFGLANQTPGTLLGYDGATGAAEVITLGTGLSMTGSTLNSSGGGGGFTNPMTAQYDLIIGGSGGTPTRLATGTSNWVLHAGSEQWAPVSLTSDVSGTLAWTAIGLPSISAHTFLGASSGTTAAFIQPAFTDLSGNISISQINSGTGASSSTYLRGDNTWATPSGSGGDAITSPNSTLNVGGSSSATTLDLNLAHSNTFTALQGVTIGSVGTGYTDALELYNTTAATASVPQDGPSDHRQSQGWSTGSGISMPADWWIRQEVTSGSVVPTNALGFWGSQNGGTKTETLLLTQGQGISVIGSVTSSVNYFAGATGGYTWGAAGTAAGMYSDATYEESLRQSTHAIELDIFNTYTSGSAYEKATLGFQANANVFTIQPGVTGGGTVRNGELAGIWGVGTAPVSTSALTLSAPTTTLASMTLIPSSAVNVTSPVNGNLWYNGINLYFYNGTTNKDLLAGASTPTLQQVLTAGATLTGTNTIAIGTGTFAISGTGSVAVAPTISTGLVISTHLQGNAPSSQPPSIAAGSGAGTSPTIGLTGGDQSGIITVTAGTLPTAGATVITVTYHTAYTNGSYPVLMPANAATALLSGATMVYTTGNTTTFTINAGTTGLTAATAYSWYYYVGAD